MSSSNQSTPYSVSVVIPAYNMGPSIARAVDSVLAQSRPADEIIVVDDGSIDDTAAVLKSYGSQIRPIHQENAGACAARNRGIQAASSDWIAFLDGDDEWIPQKLEMQIEHLRRNPDLLWSYSNLLVRDSENEQYRPEHNSIRAEKMLAGKEFFPNYLEACRRGFYITTITLIIRRRMLIEVEMFRIGQKRLQEADLSFRMAFRRPMIGYINQPLAYYNRSGPTTITMTHQELDVLYDVVDRNLALAAKYGCEQEFRSLAAMMIGGWMLKSLKEKQQGRVREMLGRYKQLLPAKLQREMIWRLRLPRAMPIYLGTISRMKKAVSPAWWKAKLEGRNQK